MVQLNGEPNQHEEVILNYRNVLGTYVFDCSHNEKPAFKKIASPDDKWSNQQFSERVYFHAGNNPSVLGVLKCLSICFMSLVSMLVIMFVLSILSK